jgi:enolase-phosphatase E1
MTKAILTDIEGTTSSIAFVTDTLFPYARTHMRDFIGRHPVETAPIIAAVPGDDPIETLLGWMDADAKETALKTLQGMIWTEGYADGTLEGHVYPDAACAMRRWADEGLDLYIYSSGSVAAQKLIFGHSNEGDLTPLFSGYFDTTIGAKKEPASYAKIAAKIGLPPAEILFLSDNADEINAALEAGMQVLLVDRETGSGDVASFAEITP